MDAEVWKDDNDDRRDSPGDSSDLKKLEHTHMNVHWLLETDINIARKDTKPVSSRGNQKQRKKDLIRGIGRVRIMGSASELLWGK